MSRRRAFIEISVDWAAMTPFERGQMYEQARQLENRFAPRDRSNVSGVFANLAVSALIFNAQQEGRPGVSAIPKDVTAPDDHYRDDLGTIVAFVLIFRDDSWTLPRVREAWSKVIEDVQAERDRLAGLSD